MREKTITFHLEGRPMKEEEELGSTLAMYISALNSAEKQIEALIKVINEAEVHKDYLEDYLDEFPEEDNYKAKYKIEDIKDALFHSMMKKDEKKISYYLNQLNVITEKQKA
jgi:N-methylhydantoinase B/oxoprolinase/acetone carboxylase alpha subunit